MRKLFCGVQLWTRECSLSMFILIPSKSFFNAFTHLNLSTSDTTHNAGGAAESSMSLFPRLVKKVTWMHAHLKFFKILLIWIYENCWYNCFLKVSKPHQQLENEAVHCETNAFVLLPLSLLLKFWIYFFNFTSAEPWLHKININRLIRNWRKVKRRKTQFL